MIGENDGGRYDWECPPGPEETACFCDGNGSVACWDCGDGDGWVLTCVDDMCRGVGECMHGDGYDMCDTCRGKGFVPCPCSGDGDD